jgi:hypothetical protein
VEDAMSDEPKAPELACWNCGLSLIGQARENKMRWTLQWACIRCGLEMNLEASELRPQPVHPNTGKSEPPPSYEAAPPNVTAMVRREG